MEAKEHKDATGGHPIPKTPKDDAGWRKVT